MCLNETYNGVRIGKNLYDVFLVQNNLKEEDALLRLLLNFALYVPSRRSKEMTKDLNWTEHQLLVYADDISIYKVST
jgi:hypothetical protein